MTNAVTAVPPAPSDAALRRYSEILSYETDCWDVHEALSGPSDPGFVLLDVRGDAAFAAGHIDGAACLPHGKIVASKLAAYPTETLFVTYCAGPHCNGAVRGAARLAALGRPVKVMPGGVTGWTEEGFPLVRAAERAT